MTKRIALVCAVVAAMAAAPVVWAQSGPTATRSSLDVPSGNVMLFNAFATGVQIYVCAARTDDAGAFAWTFKAPEAELWNDLNETIGTHYAGPSWEGNDGSTVVGEVVARADAPDASAIPWLLLRAKSNGGGGVFSNITYIQRVETIGGVAPAEGCDRAAAGVERAVPYTAVYAFYYRAAR